MSELLAALYRNQPDEVTRLLAAHPTLDVFEAAATGRIERVAELLSRDPELARACAPDGFQPLGLAAFFGHAGVVALLLRHGADPNAPSRNAMSVTALHSAVANGADDAAALALIAAGADVNARQQGGWRPLHAAAQNGARRIVAALLAAGADPRATNDDGATAASLAAAAGHRELAGLLG